MIKHPFWSIINNIFINFIFKKNNINLSLHVKMIYIDLYKNKIDMIYQCKEILV